MEKGFLFFYDWLEPFKKLSSEEFTDLFFSLVEYQQKGIKPKNLSEQSSMIAAFVIPQIDRRKALCGARKKPSVNNKLITQDKDKDKNKDKDKYIDIDIDTHSDKNARYAHDGKSAAFPSEKVKEMFDIFWEDYPKKNCKVRAEKAFIDLAPDESLFEDILFAIDVQKTTGRLNIDEPRYIPTAAKWLLEKRWTDEVSGEELFRCVYNGQ